MTARNNAGTNTTAVVDVRKYAVGCGYEGHPTRSQKREALRQMLSKYSARACDWHTIPEIRVTCYCGGEYENTVSVLDWGRLLTADLPECSWAVYGVLLGSYPPVDGLTEGVRMPVRPWSSV